MKYRNGFVTNSSSSSYICDVCGHDASGWDLGLVDAEMYQCVNGHTFCEEHTSDFTNDDNYVVLLLQRQIDNVKTWTPNSYNTPEKIAGYLEASEKDLTDFLDGKMTAADRQDLMHDSRGEVPEVFCPICNFESFIDNDILSFILKNHGFDRKVIEKSIKSQFKSYKEFMKWLKEKGE